MDNMEFNEQVVKRVNKPKHLIIKIISILILLLIPVIAAMIAILIHVQYVFVVGFFAFCAGIYIVWYVFSSQRVEYDYSVAGNDLDISKVISLRKRKKMCQVSINEIEILTRDESEIENMRFAKTYIAPRDVDAKDENYYAVFNNPMYGKCLLVFSPNDQILEGMKPRLDKSIVVKLFYKRER